MKRITAALFVGFVVTFLLLSGCFEIGKAHADGSGSAIAAAIDVGSGSAAAPAPAKHVCTLDGKQVECSELAEHPQETASEVTKLWKGGAMVCAVILALFALLTWASKHIAWLEMGKRAAYVATALTFLAVLVEPASRGTTPTLPMLMSAAFGAFVFFTNSTKKPKTAGPASS